MSTAVGIVVFPGTNCEQDVAWAMDDLGIKARLVFHRSHDLPDVEAVIVPGGFAHGDYLRPGALARFSPVMQAVSDFAAAGGPVIGICNGFQVLCEAGLLPGALRKNSGLRFLCQPVHVRVESTDTPLTRGATRGQVLEIPINHFEGNYAAAPDDIARLEDEGRVVMRYCTPGGEVTPDDLEANPNGSTHAIAGVCNETGNVVGLMPHPERASAAELGSSDGLVLLRAAYSVCEPVIAVHRALGLTDEEYAQIREIQGGEPTETELAMYAVMWSEHCSYKSSRVHLARLPTEAPHVLVGPGENAGIVDIGDGLAVAVRIESHNHPSAVEPYQGAATGVGGILRDIFTMGARPIALFDALRFGPLDDAHNRFLLEGVVAGISGYGNAVGVPTLGGDLHLDPGYSGNPLVNVGCVGLVTVDRIVLARASTPGSVAVLLGSATGRDGIGGASVLASASFEAGDDDKRPSVQVGDPFGEKRLIEACLEMLEAGVLEGLQDLGAAGLTGATSEVAARGGAGMDVDVARVPRREPGMTPVEVMTSESQERMLAIVGADSVPVVETICRKWEVHAARVGWVTDTGRLRVLDRAELVADVPASGLVDEAPRYHRPQAEPVGLTARRAAAPPAPQPAQAEADLLRLLAEPGIASSEWIWRQYDHQLFLHTVAGPGAADAAVLRLRGRSDGLAVTVDGNPRLGAVDPRAGAAHAVTEACRNVACTGARPLALVNCLNFGNPERPEVMWQLSEAIDGMADACRALDLPVVGGNVSLYNATGEADILPTPVVMVVGHLERVDRRIPGLALRTTGEAIVVIGEDHAELGGSAWAWVVAGHRDGAPPAVRLAEEIALGGILRTLAAESLVSAAHDVSEGGLGVCLAEMAIAGGRGIEVDVPSVRELWSETAARAVVATAQPSRVLARAADAGLPAFVIGEVRGRVIQFGSGVVDLAEATDIYQKALD